MAKPSLAAGAQVVRWHVYPDIPGLVTRVSQAIARISSCAITERGMFHIVLAGGNTPSVVYEHLRGMKCGWNRWQVYFGDERCLPRGHEGRNDRMAIHALLTHVPIPDAQVIAIPAELGADDGARIYSRQIASVERFDLVLLGLGEDGHTASLFPGNEIGIAAHAPDVLAVHDAPKPPPERISLSARRLSQARHIFFLVTGRGKNRALNAWRQGAAIPASFISAEDGVEGFITEDLLACADHVDVD